MAALSVLGLVSLGVWAVEVIKEGKHPLNFWLVVSLAIALAAAILWGLRRGGSADAGGHHLHLPTLGPGGGETVETTTTETGGLKVTRRAAEQAGEPPKRPD